MGEGDVREPSELDERTAALFADLVGTCMPQSGGLLITKGMATIRKALAEAPSHVYLVETGWLHEGGYTGKIFRDETKACGYTHKLAVERENMMKDHKHNKRYVLKEVEPSDAEKQDGIVKCWLLSQQYFQVRKVVVE